MQISYQYGGKWHIKSLAKAEVTVGRPNNQAGVDIDLTPDTTVSRVHAKLWREEDGSCWVEDMGSRHGTKVNGATITGKHCLNEGDEVGIGETTLRMDPS
jgi:pSer/pThr/pTyr-binding forkhead associated (FHA) protein